MSPAAAYDDVTNGGKESSSDAVAASASAAE
jgi:hypothetical protein